MKPCIAAELKTVRLIAMREIRPFRKNRKVYLLYFIFNSCISFVSLFIQIAYLSADKFSVYHLSFIVTSTVVRERGLCMTRATQQHADIMTNVQFLQQRAGQPLLCPDIPDYRETQHTLARSYPLGYTPKQKPKPGGISYRITYHHTHSL